MSLILLAGLAGYALSNPRRRRGHRRRRNPDDTLSDTQRELLTLLVQRGGAIPYWDLREKSVRRLFRAYKTCVKRGYVSSEDEPGPVRISDKGLAALGKTNPRRRRNPLSLDALAMPAANLLWRKHGYQSPGHAEDLAMMARRGTTAAKLWARVAQITKGWLYGGKKRSNPPREFSKEARAYLRLNKRARAAHDRRDWKEAERLQAEAMVHFRKAPAEEQKAIQAFELVGMMKGFAKALFSLEKR